MSFRVGLISAMFLCLLFGMGGTARAANMPQVVATNVFLAPSGPEEQVVLYLTQAISYDSFFLSNPDRLVIDMPIVEWKAAKGLPPNYEGKLLSNIRAARFNATTTRLVLDLRIPAELQGVVLRNRGSEFLLIIQLAPKGAAAATPERQATALETALPHMEKPNLANPTEPSRGDSDWAEIVEKQEAARKIMPANLPFTQVPVPVFKAARFRKPTVVLDAGHGGRDPGAQGVSGTREKDVTLRYVLALRHALLKTGRFNVAVTREDDTFILLRERLEMGRRAKGDIFISIHADSAGNHETRGLSVYTLSETASDKEAAALATRENKVDLIYGMNLSTESPDVTEILIDLAQRETKNKSSKLADHLVAAVGQVVKLLPNTHRYAGFAVLKAPDVPSVLVELGFLSNRKDEMLINSAEYRERVVSSMAQGIEDYFRAQHFWE